MNRYALTLLACIGLLFTAGADAVCQAPQPADSSGAVEQEILSHQETDLSLLGKSRLVLLEAFNSNDTTKARRVLEYMKGRFDTSKVVAITPPEAIFIAYWMRDYDAVFSFARTYDPDDRSFQKKLLPLRDLFYDELRKKSEQESMRLAEGVRASGLPAEKKDFLYLFLKYMLTEKKETQEENAADQNELNRAADEYLHSYRDSEFTMFVRRYIRFVMARSDWGFGYEMAVGYMALPSPLGARVKDFGLLTMTLESAYRNVYAGLRIDIGGAHNTRKEFTYNGTWKEGLLVMETGVLLSSGPMFELGNNFIVTPQAGFGYYDFSPPEDEKNKEGNDVSLSFAAWALGVNFDIPLTGPSGSTYLRLNVGYRTAMTDIAIARGGYTFVTIGVDFFGRPEYRDL